MFNRRNYACCTLPIGRHKVICELDIHKCLQIGLKNSCSSSQQLPNSCSLAACQPNYVFRRLIPVMDCYYDGARLSSRIKVKPECESGAVLQRISMQLKMKEILGIYYGSEFKSLSVDVYLGIQFIKTESKYNYVLTLQLRTNCSSDGNTRWKIW